jgi:hypothetical protein
VKDLLSCGIITDELQLLDDMYQDMDGYSWRNNDGWVQRRVNRGNCYGIHIDEVVETKQVAANYLEKTTLDKIIRINLDSNNLHGPALSFPVSLGLCVSLVELNLSNNHIQGEILGSLHGCESLEVLNAGHNNLTGPIPATLCGLLKLKVLNLSDNALDGHLPDQLGQLRSLEEMHLQCNQLSGPIPDSFVYLTSLKLAQLYRNELSGCIPYYLGFCRSLVLFDMRENDLEGDIPVSSGARAAALTVPLNMSFALQVTFGMLRHIQNFAYDHNPRMDEMCQLGMYLNDSWYERERGEQTPTRTRKLSQYMGAHMWQIIDPVLIIQGAFRIRSSRRKFETQKILKKAIIASDIAVEVAKKAAFFAATIAYKAMKSWETAKAYRDTQRHAEWELVLNKERQSHLEARAAAKEYQQMGVREKAAVRVRETKAAVLHSYVSKRTSLQDTHRLQFTPVFNVMRHNFVVAVIGSKNFAQWVHDSRCGQATIRLSAKAATSLRGKAASSPCVQATSSALARSTQAVQQRSADLASKARGRAVDSTQGSQFTRLSALAAKCVVVKQTVKIMVHVKPPQEEEEEDDSADNDNGYYGLETEDPDIVML